MTRLGGFDKLLHWLTVLFVAGMLPLSCIVHCHIHSPTQTHTTEFFVCHPFTTVDTESPQHLHAQTGVLRATHEVVLSLMFMPIGILLRSALALRPQTYSRWYPSPITPPPREPLAGFAVAVSQREDRTNETNWFISHMANLARRACCTYKLHYI